MRLHDGLEYHARIRPDAEFATMGERSLRYAEADAAANRIAHALEASGLEKGDRAVFLAKNCLEFLLFFYGASKAGVVPVPLNYRLAGPEWSYIVNDSGARLVIARGELVGALDAVRDELPHVKRFVALGAEARGWEPWEEWLQGRPATPLDRLVSTEDDLYQMYTSGTTGRPKGAVLTQRAVTSQLQQATLAFDGRAGERALIVAPLYHAAAAITAFVTIQNAGTAYVQEDFVPAEVVRALSEERIAVALLVPAMIQFCLVGVPDVAARRFDHLRLVVYGASPIAEQTLRRALEVFGCSFLQGYGMTETTAAATYLLPEDHARALDGRPELLLSAGRALLGTEIRIVDEDGRPLPAGEVGEVAVRGPQLMRGYWNLPESTKEALRGGWMHTGDAGALDAEGYLFIRDRVKDMIVSGGENVYPREIEEVLFQHPAIADVAVIGVPDERFGEAVKAVAVLRAGASATGDELIAFCEGRLAGYKRPRSVDFVAVLPRNPSGKVLKRELREPHWQGRTRGVN